MSLKSELCPGPGHSDRSGGLSSQGRLVKLEQATDTTTADKGLVINRGATECVLDLLVSHSYSLFYPPKLY